ncbi:CRISPR-associated endonuclease Cas1 [Bacterioplanes sanyensis]|uniref:type I-F CRISPR-associated endonuclease Cas1f n=1 Tax=Bacterioplanes sanyensis TaxID=1249553 RepID=UPI00167BE03E|nr:type I-F CRISPR-associated endonuclease Cas1f [Bacterioplanes sanyensis]GGY57542.1 CRISPR-associated endonuclease Cas1 [Bacterioplanes sanyensis]
MDDLSPSDLKTILHSKRANIYYLQHCRVLVNGGRVEYVTDEGKQSLYWNIPIANTSSVLLGTGTSITQAAMREFAKAGVMVGFCGGGGTPLFSANEFDIDVSFLSPQSEYRPIEYLQQWLRFWLDDDKRLAAAKSIQTTRIDYTRRQWFNPQLFDSEHFHPIATLLHSKLDAFAQQVEAATDIQEIMLAEARLTKSLYQQVCQATGYNDFSRVKRGKGADPANRYLDHGNYLAYGLAATASWVLGLPHGLSVLHGKTRRGGLVFDVADMVKDALVMPQAFISAMQGHEEQEFRQACIRNFQQVEVLDFMIEQLKTMAATFGEHA